MEGLISVIVPIYNFENCLQKCVDSILNQSYTNLEVILVNDGSKDQSGKVCDYYAQIDSRVKVIHKKNGGASDARNKGLDVATGEYIGFVDGDDWIEKDFFRTLYELIQTHEADLSMISYNEVRESGVSAHSDSDNVFVMEQYELFQSEAQKYLRYILPNLKQFKRMILLAMLWDLEKGKEVVRMDGALHE